MSIFYSSIVLIEVVIKKTSLEPVRKHLVWLFLISISTMLLNVFIIIGYKLAPNPGFIDAANTASVSAITLLAVVFFQDELTLKKAIGIIGVTIGLISLFL